MKKQRHMIDLDDETYRTVKKLAEEKGCWMTRIVKNAVDIYKKMVHEK